MTPPIDTVLRRRHIALMALRAAAVGLIVYGVVSDQHSIQNVFSTALHGQLNLGTIIDLFARPMRLVLPGLVLALASRRLAAWIVPAGGAGLRADGCPHCGYSVKNLKSPICPECGGDLGGVGGVGRR